MVRAEEWNSRERILNIIITGEEPCRRLFLDYHGLRLLWAWMANLPIPSPNTETQLIRDDKYHMLVSARLLQNLQHIVTIILILIIHFL